MKKIILFALALCLFFTASGAAFAEETAENGIVLNDGTPWVDYALCENIAQLEEKPDSPKDDFYLWANYDWLRSAEITTGNLAVDNFTDCEYEILDQCLAILSDTTQKGEDAAMVQHLYNAYMDWDARDSLGLAPLQEIIERISAVSTLEELTQMLSSEDYIGDSFITTGLELGVSNPDIWIANIAPINLLLNDSAEYREMSEQGKALMAAYKSIISKQLERMGYSPEEASGIVSRSFALETELAESMMTSAEIMAPDYNQRIMNEVSRAEAETLCSAFPFPGILDGGAYAGAQRYRIEEPAYLQKLDEIYREDRLEDLKDFLISRTVRTYIGSLDRETYGLTDELYAVYGVEGIRPDEITACLIVRGALPTQMARAFFGKYDMTKMKADITRICRDTIDCYRKMLGEEDWLTEETRAKAIEKLDKMHIMAVCPEKMPDYSGLSLEGLGYFDCMKEIARAQSAVIRSLVDQPIDHDLWFFTTNGGINDIDINDILLVNAAYASELNTIVILRGILASGFYREDMSDEELYGGIGMVIAHEISHAFDPSGAQYDADGRMANWWTEADSAAFDARAKKVIDYYDGMTVFSGLQVPGESVQGEAIADIAGVKCMLRLLEEKKKGDVDYRAFFESIAKVWREMITWEGEYYYLLQDPHPPCYIRVNTIVQQFPQFYETYGITEGDGMWLKPEDRILVW